MRPARAVLAGVLLSELQLAAMPKASQRLGCTPSLFKRPYECGCVHARARSSPPSALSLSLSLRKFSRMCVDRSLPIHISNTIK